MPGFCVFQVEPPFVVARMVPPLPTTQPSLALEGDGVEELVVPELWAIQVEPPFVVARMVPLLLLPCAESVRSAHHPAVPGVREGDGAEPVYVRAAVGAVCAFQVAPSLLVGG